MGECSKFCADLAMISIWRESQAGSLNDRACGVLFLSIIDMAFLPAGRGGEGGGGEGCGRTG